MLSRGLTKFEQCFMPHRRVISCDSDLLALNVSIPSVSRVNNVCLFPLVHVVGLHVVHVVVVHLFVSLEHCAGSVRRVHINQLSVPVTNRGNTVMKLMKEQKC